VTLTDDELARRAMSIDPDRSNIILCVGKKGSGKSEAARQIFNAYPYDRVVLDVTGDARPDDPATIAMAAPFPSQMPRPEDPERNPRVSVWARVDPRSDSYLQDQDQALALGLYPRHNHCMLLIDEYAEAATANRIEKNMKLALISSRHYSLSLLLCCPRAVSIPVITMQQADRVFIFKVANRDDRDVIAKNIGFPIARFEEAYHEMRKIDEHAFLLWDAQQDRLFICPPLPGIVAKGPRA
jgi:hypothetical protein